MNIVTYTDHIEVDGVKFVRADSVNAEQVKKREGAWMVGEKYIIRTVTMMQTGRLVYIDDKELILEDAAWIADSGRWSDALATGTLNEIEPFDDEVVIGRSAIIDATIWKHALPKVKK